MEEVFVMTRDVNGKRNYHYLRWDNVCDYVLKDSELRDEEILMVMVNDICIYSALQDNRMLSWEALVGFFA
jgi:hypothetical protein